MLTELFLPTKGGTAVSFDDDFLFTQGAIPTCTPAQLAGIAEHIPCLID